jgi:predicted nucleic acid-binding Zn ribbon protein
MYPLGDLFPLFAEKFVEIPEMQEGLIRIAWKRCVGERISNLTDVKNYRDGVLTVCVAAPEWKVTLAGLKTDIIVRMNRYLMQNLIRDLRIETEKF